MSEREHRVGENEALYRSINERIEDLNEAFGTLSGAMTVICECGDGACAEQIELDVPTYERVRADPTHFIVRPGHDIPDVEETVEKHERYWIVEKHSGEPERVAVETDPRS
jgi:hypothetical protein